MIQDRQLIAACALSLLIALPLAAWLESAWSKRNAEIATVKEQLE